MLVVGSFRTWCTFWLYILSLVLACRGLSLFVLVLRGVVPLEWLGVDFWCTLGFAVWQSGFGFGRVCCGLCLWVLCIMGVVDYGFWNLFVDLWDFGCLAGLFWV